MHTLTTLGRGEGAAVAFERLVAKDAVLAPLESRSSPDTTWSPARGRVQDLDARAGDGRFLFFSIGKPYRGEESWGARATEAIVAYDLESLDFFGPLGWRPNDLLGTYNVMRRRARISGLETVPDEALRLLAECSTAFDSSIVFELGVLYSRHMRSIEDPVEQRRLKREAKKLWKDLVVEGDVNWDSPFHVPRNEKSRIGYTPTWPEPLVYMFGPEILLEGQVPLRCARFYCDARDGHWHPMETLLRARSNPSKTPSTLIHAHPAARRNPEYWGRAGAGILFLARDTGRVLFPLRSEYVKEPGTWGVWGGKIDEDESPPKAAAREAMEEMGIEVHEEDLVPLMVYRDPGVFTYYNYLAIVPEEFAPELNWETDDYRWVDIGNWPEPLHPKVELLLKDKKSISTMHKYARRPVRMPSKQRPSPRPNPGAQTMNPTQRVRTAIEATRRVAPGYFESTAAQRAELSPTQRGSMYEGMDGPGVERAIEAISTWEETTHPDLMPGTFLLRAKFPGRRGDARVRDLPIWSRVLLEDPKKTGEVSATVKGILGEYSEDTYIILGDEQGTEIVFTFHPGPPAPYRVIKTAGVLPESRWVSPLEALELGVETAEIKSR